MTRPTAGFTLIELIVVTGIIALISSLVLVNNNRFGGEVLLQNLSYDIALSIRQAQQYGISVQNFQGDFGAAYGMHFQLSPSSGNGVYVLFADAVNHNGLYDSGELVQSTTISQGYRVADLCVTPPSSAEVCGLSTLDITFQRPEPDAYIRSSVVSGLGESARIRVESPRGDVKDITVESNGQIAVH
ncbi:MAG TPA: prepilin-type N-terminal cleavage/methylation domain-containing protein [Candidatus Paceibacterota bacterium]|nr:prepilin-type N-terminal cleavage/methylation domain-containing protein [Candidatus Paceibacterota bacterium]